MSKFFFILCVFFTQSIFSYQRPSVNGEPSKGRKRHLIEMGYNTRGPFVVNGFELMSAKKELIYRAEQHKTEWVKKAKILKYASKYFPDLEDSRAFSTLIETAISSTAIQDPRQKVLAIGLALLGNFTADTVQHYRSYKKLLCEVTYHLEMYNFYSYASLGFPDGKPEETQIHLGIRNLYTALDELTLCDLLSICIDDLELHVEVSDIVCGQREKVLEAVQNDILVSRVSESALYSFTQVKHILCPNQDYLYDQLVAGMLRSYHALHNCEYYWDIK